MHISSMIWQSQSDLHAKQDRVDYGVVHSIMDVLL